jgi:hypothetical protein
VELLVKQPFATVFWVIFALTATVYATMLGSALPRISAEAGGGQPFDMRPLGYSFEEARDFLSHLSAEGKDFYLNIQQRLDTAYPALYTATLGLAIYRLTPERLGRWKWPLIVIPMAGAGFDYVENAAVARLLRSGAESLRVEDVAAASRATILKSIFTRASIIIVIVFLAIWFSQRLSAHRRKER